MGTMTEIAFIKMSETVEISLGKTYGIDKIWKKYSSNKEHSNKVTASHNTYSGVVPITNR